MKRLLFLIATTLVITSMVAVLASEEGRQPVDWVDPMLGTSSSRWMLYPGPSMPFGKVKLSPDNEDFPKRWYKGGHEYFRPRPVASTKAAARWATRTTKPI